MSYGCCATGLGLCLIPQTPMAKPAVNHRYAILGVVVVLLLLYMVMPGGGKKKAAANDWKTCKHSEPLVARAEPASHHDGT